MQTNEEKCFTAIFRDVTKEEASDLCNHPKWTAGAWGHALDQRDDARHEVAKLRAQADARPVAWLSPGPGEKFYVTDEALAKHYGYTRAVFDCPSAEASATGLSEEEKKALELAIDMIHSRYGVGEKSADYLLAILERDSTAALQARLTRASAATVDEPSTDAVGGMKEQATITLRQAESLLQFFGGHDAEVAIAQYDGGLIAWCTECPEEGSFWLGKTEVDDELADKGRPQADQQQAEPCPECNNSKTVTFAGDACHVCTQQAEPTVQRCASCGGAKVPQTLLATGACDCEQAEPGADERAAQKMREAFEAYLMDLYPNGHEDVSEQRVGDEYIHQSTTGKWLAWKAACKWQARAAQSGQRAGVAEGWRFYSADFSITAHQPSQPGYVMLIRDEIGYKKWHRMDEATKEEIPLFVTGRGVTFEKALLHANENAMLAAPTQQQEGGS